MIVWAFASPSGQVTPVPATESTMRRLSTVSVRVRLSASETPLLVTLTLNVWLPVPASTLSSAKVLVVVRTTFSTIATDVVLESDPPSSAVAEAVLLTAAALSVVLATW